MTAAFHAPKQFETGEGVRKTTYSYSIGGYDPAGEPGYVGEVHAAFKELVEKLRAKGHNVSGSGTGGSL